jgi:hypothetical protein
LVWVGIARFMAFLKPESTICYYVLCFSIYDTGMMTLFLEKRLGENKSSARIRNNSQIVDITDIKP